MNKPRLIDANEWIKELRINPATNVLDRFVNERIIYLLEKRPTAYDIQGVVEHMELIIELADKDLCVPGRNCHGNCQEHYLEAMVEIVKGGAE